MIRKIALSVVVILVIVGVSVAAVAHYNQYKNQKAHDQQIAQIAASRAQAQEKASATADQAKLVAQYNNLLVECEKGSNLYAQVPAIYKKNIQTPHCGAVLVR